MVRAQAPAVSLLASISLLLAEWATQASAEMTGGTKELYDLRQSLSRAASHIAMRLDAGPKKGSTFGGYELDFGGADGSGGAWRHHCQDLNATRDTVENCALQQLRALTTLCDVSDLVRGDSKDATSTIVKHLKALTRDEIPGLGMKRFKQNIPGKTYELWTNIKTPESASTDTDISPVLGSATLEAALRCINATGKRKYLDDTIPMFTGVAYVYNEQTWNKSLYNGNVDFEKAAQIYHSLVSALWYLPVSSSLSETMRTYVEGFEDFLYRAWKQHENLNSFEMMRAIPLRVSARSWLPLKTKRQKVLIKFALGMLQRFAGVKKMAEEVKGTLGKTLGEIKNMDTKMADLLLKGVDHYMFDAHGDLTQQIMTAISDRVGIGGYQCKIQRGLLPTLQLLGDSAYPLLKTCRSFVKNDARKYQIVTAEPDYEKLGPADLDHRTFGTEMNGAFIMDDEQLKSEGRRSLAIRDTVWCMDSVAELLRQMKGEVGVKVKVIDASSELKVLGEAGKNDEL